MWLDDRLDLTLLRKPLIAKDAKRYQPSEAWINQLTQFEGYLTQALQETNPVNQRDAYKKAIETLEEFRSIHFRESALWAPIYKEVFPKWEEEMEYQLKILIERAGNLARNPYRIGDPLSPQKDDLGVFMGRDDIINDFQAQIALSNSFLLFLIWGQRRVGKTSLLLFLEQYLGVGFRIIQINMQSRSFNRSMQDLLEQMRVEINKSFGIVERDKDGKRFEWKATDDWAYSFDEMAQYVLAISRKYKRKTLFAIDEYEEIHTRHFMKEPVKGGDFLATMRSFMQQQDEVLFLFAGMARFKDLTNPRWNDYFVQAKPIFVGYLNKADSHKLITAPYEGFPKKYPAELVEKIFYLTQGHPALLQLIGHEMVSLSNRQDRQELRMEDLDWIIENKILDSDDRQPFDVFWNQFCADSDLKNAVFEIISTMNTQYLAALRKLQIHQFVEQSPDGKWKMKVPLFEQWVNRYGMY